MRICLFIISDNLWEKKLEGGFIDYVIQLDIPRDEVKENSRDGRNIWCYPAGDLRIENYPHKYMTVEDED